MTTDEHLVERLRSALDELTDGAQPNAEPTTAPPPRQPNRWKLPVAAAAAVLVALAAVTVAAVRRDGGEPSAPIPTPTGPAVDAVPTIPWYELHLDDGTVGSAPIANFRGAPSGASDTAGQAWATPGFERVVVAQLLPVQNAFELEHPNAEPLPDPPAGKAWIVPDEAPTATWRTIYWAPDDGTSGFVGGYGYNAAELADVLQTLHVDRTGGPMRIVSTLSALVPLGVTGDVYSSSYLHEQQPGQDPVAPIVVSVSTAGAGLPLAFFRSPGSTVRPATTPFGSGFRIDGVFDQAMVWWPVDGGPYWAGVSGPPEQIDDLLARVTRVADILLPTPADESDATEPPPGLSVAPSAPATIEPVVAVGDSIMLGAAAAMNAAGITVFAEEATQASWTRDTLRTLRDQGELGDQVVLQTGTNGTLDPAILAEIMTTLADVPEVVVLTVHAPGKEWIARNNELLRALPATHANVEVVDWDAYASTCDCLSADGMHVRDAPAAESYAALVALALDD